MRVSYCRPAGELHLASMPWQSSPMASYLRVLTKVCVKPSADPLPPKLSASHRGEVQPRVLRPPHPHPATPHRPKNSGHCNTTEVLPQPGRRGSNWLSMLIADSGPKNRALSPTPWQPFQVSKGHFDLRASPPPLVATGRDAERVLSVPCTSRAHRSQPRE